MTNPVDRCCHVGKATFLTTNSPLTADVHPVEIEARRCTCGGVWLRVGVNAYHADSVFFLEWLGQTTGTLFDMSEVMDLVDDFLSRQDRRKLN